MKTHYITPESAADQSPAQRNSERLNAKKVPGLRTEAELEIDPKRKEEELKKDPHAPKKNPAENEGSNYDKVPAESDIDDNDFNPKNMAQPGKKEQESGNDDDDSGQYQEETNPAMPPEKTRETPQANPKA